jgi:hypothetical protein
MNKLKVGFVFSVAAVAVSAVAQTGTTVTNSNNGVSGTVPVYSGAATLGSGSASPITVSGSNVGIGTSSPQTTLQVGTNTSAGALYVAANLSNNSPDTFIAPYKGVWIEWNDLAGMTAFVNNEGGSTGGWQFVNANTTTCVTQGCTTSNPAFTTPMVIQGTSGNVGIGTTSPPNPLTINRWTSGGSWANANQLSIQGDNWGGTSGYGLSIGYQYNWPETATASGGIIQSDTGGSPSLLLLNPNGGYVGIGTPSPGAALEVNGNTQIDGGLNIGTGGITFPNGSVQSVAFTGCGTNEPTASALAATPTACAPGQVATGIAANGNAICSALNSSANGWTSGNSSGNYWVKDPTGHIHQWGVVPAAGVSVTFPTPFTILSSIVVVAGETHSGAGAPNTATSITISGFSFTNGDGANDSGTWIADGY